MHPICHWPWALPQLRDPVSTLQTTADVEIGNPLLYATRCPLTLSYHHKEPSPQFIVHWWKSALSRKLSRRNIDNLITFLATNEDIIKSQNTTPSHTLA
ncbi:hypothetical protein AVEN_128666-1 [Araneus ventricosus]|uniref:Uncharacterized protein n=1 Tax=Araneus ventricosus TaxID=182803 RepID=A0A4Y2SVR6_ARAVE|nr:hypothetical protein AVEN_128666-1 [Araneus ventricosus]